MTYEINYNSQFSSYEITFDGKPSEAVREALKDLKFRWHSVKRCWYGYSQSEESIAAAIVGSSTEEEPATVYGDGYLGGGSVYGSKSNQHLHGSDLSAAIRQDLKRYGIKGATVKCKTYTGGQSLTVTVKMADSDYIPFTQFLDNYRIRGNQYWIETKSGSIHCDKYWAADAEEQERIRCEAAEVEYERMTTREADRRIDSIDFLTPAALAKVQKVDEIVRAYRYDNSNSMVDYFDTNFYYDIVVKPC
jgi:hypothetical protein